MALRLLKRRDNSRNASAWVQALGGGWIGALPGKVSFALPKSDALRSALGAGLAGGVRECLVGVSRHVPQHGAETREGEARGKERGVLSGSLGESQLGTQSPGNR